VIFFCLDNSSFLAASEEGGLIPISKCVPEDDGYHVAGALVVAPERAMQYAIAQLRRAILRSAAISRFLLSRPGRDTSLTMLHGCRPRHKVPAEKEPGAGDRPGRGTAGVWGEQHYGEEGADDEGGLGQRPCAPQLPHLSQDGAESY
jgi:hypothetical protein